MKNLEFIGWDSTYRDDFKRLNKEWLEKYFWVEDIDEQVLSNPESFILEKGGYIYFARLGDEIVGAASLIRSADRVFELSKMAVTEQYQGKGIGRQFLAYILNEYSKLDGQHLFLESNSKLRSAIHLYESFGFVHQPVKEDSHYERADVHMVWRPE